MEHGPPPEDLLRTLRQRRAELREAMNALELALSAPAANRPAAWADRVHVALVELSADLREHVEVTEGSEGLYADVLRTAPRLANAVADLTRHHVLLRTLVDDTIAGVRQPCDASGVDAVRELGTTVLTELSRHRQRGADLVFEAYQSDIGGET